MKKTAIVTGASRGLGRGTALILATEGNYRVYATARNNDALNKLKEEVNSLRCEGEIIPCILDQNNDDEVIEFTNKICSREDKIDLLVNNASSFYPTPLGEINDENWDDLIGTNLKGPLFLCQAAHNDLKKQLYS